MGDTAPFSTPSTARTIIPKFPELPPDASFGDRLKTTLAWWNATRLARTMAENGRLGAPVMAAGMAYMALFSVFAGLWAGFSIVGFIVADDPQISTWLIDSLASAMPGLVGDDAAIKPETLLSASVFGWTGLISLATTIWTALNWLTGARTSIRRIFELPAAPEINMVLARLRDLGLVLGAVVLVVISSTFSAAGGGALTWLLAQFGVGEDWVVRDVLIKLGGFVVSAAVDGVLLGGMIMVLSQIRVPGRILWPAAFVGGIATGLIKLLASMLVGGATANPLLAAFAALLSVLILFNLMSTVQLYVATWVKVSMLDEGAAPRLMTAEQAEREAVRTSVEARREVLAAEELQLRETLRDAPRFTHRAEKRRLREVQEERARLEADDLRYRMWGDLAERAKPDELQDEPRD